LFGGWDFTPADAQTRSPAVVGYTKGVPMGGDLTKAPAGRPPKGKALAPWFQNTRSGGPPLLSTEYVPEVMAIHISERNYRYLES